MSRQTYTELGPQDRQTMQAFLDKEPLHNLYLIHALESRAALDATAPSFWGAWHQGRLIAVLYIDRPPCPQGHCPQGRRAAVGYLVANGDRSPSQSQALAHLGALAANRADARVLTGPKAQIEPAISKLGVRTRVKRAHFYQVPPTAIETGATSTPPEPCQFVRHAEYPVHKATRDDIPRLIELYRGYEYRRQNRTDDEIQSEIEQAMSHSGTYFYIEQPDPCPGQAPQIVSAASIYPETGRAGMIGSARTLPAYRGRRMYLSVRTTAFKHVIQQGKTGLGLFVDNNTNMHRVLEKQGGTILGEWWIVHVRSKRSLRQHIRHSRLWKQFRAQHRSTR